MGTFVLMRNDRPCKIIRIRTIQIKMYDGAVRTLKCVMFHI